MNSLKNISILYLVKGNVFGGAERFAVELANGIAPEFKEVYLGSINNNLAGYLAGSNISGIAVNFSNIGQLFKFIKCLYFLNRFIKNKNITVIHSHHRIFLPLMKILSLIRPLITVYTAVNVFQDNKSKFVKPDYSIAITDSVYKNLVEQEGFCTNNTLRINYGIKLLKEELIKTKKNNSESFIVGYLGRFVHEKGVIYLIKAAALLKKYNVRFRIKGNGPEYKNYLYEVNKLNITEFVEFIEWDDDPIDFYKEIDLLVLPSIGAEGSPLVIYEAMDHEVIVIATKVGGIPDIIEDRVNGYLVNPFSETEIAETIKEIMENGINVGMIENAKKTAQKYDIKNSISEYLNFYNKILDENK